MVKSGELSGTRLFTARSYRRRCGPSAEKSAAGGLVTSVAQIRSLSLGERLGEGMPRGATMERVGNAQTLVAVLALIS